MATTTDVELLAAGVAAGYSVVEGSVDGHPGWRIVDVDRSFQPWVADRDALLRLLTERLGQVGSDPRAVDKR